MWGPGGRRLFNREGSEYVVATDELGNAEIVAWLRTCSDPVAIAPCGGAMRWIDGAERPLVWKEQLADVGYEATLWVSKSGGKQVLLFEER
jgi:hypothetical protein